jgi:pimeloyl-ACP methyl ester carboxylesterase
MQPELLTFDIPKTDTVPAHGLTCWRWGNPELPAILCVHGLTRNGRDFDFLAQALSHRFCVVCPDMPGRGKSTWFKDPSTYNYATYVGDIVFLLSALKLSRIHWIGTSMGGIIGMMLANTLPGAIASLTLNDIGCSVSAAGLKRIGNYAGATSYFTNRAEAENALRMNMATFGITEERHWQHVFAHSILEAGDGSFYFAYDPAIMATFPKGDEVKDIDLWKLWDAIKFLPVLLLRGAMSDLLTRETALQMKNSHPNLMLHEIPNAGHAPSLMDEPSIQLISNWIQSS